MCDLVCGDQAPQRLAPTQRLGYDVRRTRFRVPSGTSWGTPVPRGTSLNVIAEPEGFNANEPHA
ncbi:MAG TPA: hypothetical protein VHQ68_03420, partial [Propionibacteriaceae bacterium]|nr:hypothetical protein [Propionibacteriaceae bacterium]